MDWKTLTQDKRVLVAGGLGGALGLAALLRKRSGATASAPAAGGTTGAGYAPGALGSYDSSATDAYNNIETAMSNRLTGMEQQITSLSDQLGAIQQPVPSSSSPAGPATLSAHQQHLAHLAHVQRTTVAKAPATPSAHQQHLTHLANVRNATKKPAKKATRPGSNQPRPGRWAAV